MIVKNEIGCAPSGFEPWGSHRQRRVGILLNPQSGTTRSGFNACLQLLAQHKHVIHREVVTPEDVAAALVEMAAQQVDVLAVCGGDGTVQATLTALFHTKPFDVRPPWRSWPVEPRTMSRRRCWHRRETSPCLAASAGLVGGKRIGRPY